jgi:preprotein translocase subunit YajC
MKYFLSSNEARELKKRSFFNSERTQTMQNSRPLFLFLIILIIFLGFYSFIFAQEKKQMAQEKKQAIQTEKQVENKVSFEKIIEKLKSVWNKIVSVGENLYQKIVEIWKQKNLSQFPKTKIWLTKQISFIKEEFVKEREEMEQDVKKRFSESFLKIWLSLKQWFKSSIQNWLPS